MPDNIRNAQERIGFIGLGVMGQPMALNLIRAGTALIIWNRSLAAVQPLAASGAVVAESVDSVFGDSRIVICMLVNEAALDSVLKRGTDGFAALVRGHIVVSMGSNSPDYSRALAADIKAAGGRYVEAPVSGSRKPAELGQLVSLLGGEPQDIEEVRPLLAPMCRETVVCGPVGNALLMKLTVNLFLNTMLAGLAEAIHFADSQGLNLSTVQDAINSGPMGCDFTQVKMPKFIARDFTVQAATEDAFNSTRLIADAARAAGLATPMLDLASELYGESVALGNARLDMASVIQSIEARSAVLNQSNT